MSFKQANAKQIVNNTIHRNQVIISWQRVLEKSSLKLIIVVPFIAQQFDDDCNFFSLTNTMSSFLSIFSYKLLFSLVCVAIIYSICSNHTFQFLFLPSYMTQLVTRKSSVRKTFPNGEHLYPANTGDPFHQETSPYKNPYHINDYISLSLLNNIINIITLDDVERLAYKSLRMSRYYGNKRAAKQIHSHYSKSVICFTARASVTETPYTTIRINQEFNSWLSTLRCSAVSLGVFSLQIPAISRSLTTDLLTNTHDRSSPRQKMTSRFIYMSFSYFGDTGTE